VASEAGAEVRRTARTQEVSLFPSSPTLLPLAGERSRTALADNTENETPLPQAGEGPGEGNCQDCRRTCISSYPSVSCPAPHDMVCKSNRLQQRKPLVCETLPSPRLRQRGGQALRPNVKRLSLFTCHLVELRSQKFSGRLYNQLRFCTMVQRRHACHAGRLGP
jgi:hypothetical protein